MALIDELEPHPRGIYGGTVGYFDFAGDMDMAIAIRTALIRDGAANVQAGGGDRRRLRARPPSTRSRSTRRWRCCVPSPRPPA